MPLPRKRSPDGASPDWGCAYLIAAYYSLSTPKGWKAESAWLADLQRMVYPHKWSPISCRSSAGQGKFAGQRPTFYQLCHATNHLCGRGVCVSVCTITWKLQQISAFCLTVTQTGAKSRTSSHVKITGDGQGHFWRVQGHSVRLRAILLRAVRFHLQQRHFLVCV